LTPMRGVALVGGLAVAARTESCWSRVSHPPVFLPDAALHEEEALQGGGPIRVGPARRGLFGGARGGEA